MTPADLHGKGKDGELKRSLQLTVSDSICLIELGSSGASACSSPSSRVVEHC